MSLTTSDAAIRIMVGIDGARRAGWAKYFSTQERIDALSRDLNVLTDEREIMRKALSRMYGFLSVYVQAAHGPHALISMQTMIDGLAPVLDDAHVRAGGAEAHSIINGEPTLRTQQKRVSKEHNARTAAKLEQRFWTALSRRYGFKTYRDMKAILDHALKGYALPGSLEERYEADFIAAVRQAMAGPNHVSEP